MGISYRRYTSRLVVLAFALVSTCSCSGISVSLSRYPTHPQAEAAVDRLLSSDTTLVNEAKRELSILGEGAMPILCSNMDTANSVGRTRIMEAASALGAPVELVAEILEKGGHDESADVRQSAAFYAGRFPQLSDRLGTMLTSLANDANPHVRAAALSSLGAYPSSVQLPAEDLMRLLNDANVLVAASAASLATKRMEPHLQVAARDALPRLVGKLDDPSPAHRAVILFAIGHYGPLAEPTIPPLKSILANDKVPEVRLQAAIALVKINTRASRKAAAPALKSFARNSDPRLSTAAQSALAALQ